MLKDSTQFRQSLLHLLEADPAREEKLLQQLESRSAEQPLYSALIFILTHLSFTEDRARRHWKKITAQRQKLREALGRDVGLRVALLDYFVNVNRELDNPKVIEISIYERTERSALTDGLTGLYNHAYFLQTLRRELHRCKRHGLTMSLAMFDLDNFKRLNDTRGHLEGDKVLIKSAALIQENLRDIDTAARYGGEEFALILPETARAGAFVVADRIRAKIEDAFSRRRRGAGVTVSGGVAAFPDDAASLEDLIRRADAALYRSKAGGKNRITLAEDERRRHSRAGAEYPASLRRGESGATVPGLTRNVSESGLLLRLEKAVPIGSRVSVVIRPRDGAEMTFAGEVVRVTKADGAFDVGVRLAGVRPLRLVKRLIGRRG